MITPFRPGSIPLALARRTLAYKSSTIGSVHSVYPSSASRLRPVNWDARRVSSSKVDSPASTKSGSKQSSHSHPHSDTHAGHGHTHDHSHSGLFHTHQHDHSEGAAQIMTALSSGKVDRGTRITLLGMVHRRRGLIQGLGSNVALTATKGIAGLWMNSASLLAEAGHSLSDLLGVSGVLERY